MAEMRWQVPSSWAPVLDALLTPMLRESQRNQLKTYDGSDLYVDDPDWIKLLEDISNIPIEELVSAVSVELTKHSVLTFHGCRPVDPNSYISHGLMCHDQSILRGQLQELIATHKQLQYLEGNIDARIQEIFGERDCRSGRVYLVIDDRLLTESAGQYLIYGSEWLLCMLRDYEREILKKVGVPTIFHIRLPLLEAPPYDRDRLAEELLIQWVRLQSEPDAIPHELNFAFEFSETIAPELIVGHNHPSRIKDPFYLPLCYTNKQLRCALCEDHKNSLE